MRVGLSFHITGKFRFPDYPDQCATLYLVRFPHVRRRWRIQHMGEHLGESLRSGRLQRNQRLYLVRIFSAARCARFRQENFPSPRLRVTSKTYVKISPFHFIGKSPPDVARICEDCLNVLCLTAPSSRPWRRLKEGTKGTEFSI